MIVTLTNTPASVTLRWDLGFWKKRLCTSTQLKTDLIEDAVQMEILNCQHQQACTAGWEAGCQENSWSGGGECAGLACSPVTLTRGGSGFQGGDWAGMDLPIGGEKWWLGKVS